MLVNLSLSPGYRLKITRASRMSELADRVITAIAAVGGSAPPVGATRFLGDEAKGDEGSDVDQLLHSIRILHYPVNR